MDLAAVRNRLTHQPPTVLELDLGQGVLTGPATGPREALRALHTPRLQAIRDGLHKAATDEQVAGLVVHVGDAPLGAADLDEIAGLITAFGEKKPTIAWSETYGELTSGLMAYRLASHCQQVWIQPSGMISAQGVALTATLLRGTLDKVGLTPEFGQRHEYKSAADQYMASEVTPAHREMLQRIADSLLEETVARVATARGLTTEVVQDAVDRSPLNAQQALESGLVDRIGYRDEVYSWLRENWGRVMEPRPWQKQPEDDGPQVHLQYVHRYAKGLPSVLTGRGRPSIAVVNVTGGIVGGTGRRSPLSGPTAGSDTVSAQLRAVAREDSTKAVVLRVDSPGGSYVASDTIRREVIRLKEDGIAVVASMGAVAASGGYFVSMAADEIITTPSTLTGSIGVLAGKLVTSGLTNKLGLVRETMAAGENATMFSDLTPFTERHWEILNGWLDEVYADFTAKAAADRGLDLAKLEPLARGRVWTGADAVRHQLADQLGGIDLALDRACALAGLERDEVSVRPAASGGWLARFRPAESSESHRTESRLDLPSGAEGLWHRLMEASGLAPAGVLALPWRFTIG